MIERDVKPKPREVNLAIECGPSAPPETTRLATIAQRLLANLRDAVKTDPGSHNAIRGMLERASDVCKLGGGLLATE